MGNIPRRAAREKQTTPPCPARREQIRPRGTCQKSIRPATILSPPHTAVPALDQALRRRPEIELHPPVIRRTYIAHRRGASHRRCDELLHSGRTGSDGGARILRLEVGLHPHAP